MEFPLIFAQSLIFSQGEPEGYDFVRKAPASLEKFPNLGIGMKVCEGRSDSSDHSLGTPRQLNGDLGKSVTVQINKYNPTTRGCVSVWTTKSNVDCYEQLKKASGGQLLVDIQFELGTSDGNVKTNVNEKKVQMFKQDYDDWPVMISGPTGTFLLFGKRFDFTDSLSEIWMDDWNNFTGKLSVNLKVEEINAGQMLRFCEAQNPLVAVNKRMQMDTNFTDATLVPKKGKGIKCHKIVLIASSDYFRKMFESKMKEGVTGTVNIPDMTSKAAQALLDYLYCQDTTKASKSPSVALELLMKADEYSIESLEKAMLQLMHAKENDWFSVGVALKLFEFSRKKFENEGLIIYQFAMQKAVMVLKSKSKKEVEESNAFHEFFNDDKSQMALFTYCMFST